VTAKGIPVIARSDSTETVHRRNELLPETRVEAAFPLRIGDMVIGALDLQSKIDDSFREDDLPIFQSLADHIAIAIDNARLFDETEKNLQDNQRLVEQSRQAIGEVERLNQRLTGRFWDDFLGDQEVGSTGISVQFDNPRERQELTWTPTLQEAIRFNRSVQQQDNNQRVVALPLRVRGQVIGAMEFELDATGNLSTEDMNLLEEVGEQLGLAAETTRLFQGSQRLAQREALVNEIATRLQTSNNVETTLTEAARSLRDALRAEKVVIRLGPPPTNGNGSNGGQA
jgi:GAF domain-containing protein